MLFCLGINRSPDSQSKVVFFFPHVLAVTSCLNRPLTVRNRCLVGDRVHVYLVLGAELTAMNPPRSTRDDG